jgi:hypothetical protein
MMVEAPDAVARRRRWRAQGQRRNRAIYYGYSAFGGTLGGAPVFVAGEIPIALLPVGDATSGHDAGASVAIGLAVTAEATVAPPGGTAIDASASVVIGLTVTASAIRTGDGSAAVPVALTPTAQTATEHGASGGVPIALAPAAQVSIGLIIMRLIAGLRIMPRYRADVDIAPEE